jgi:Zn-dependent protease with chaperone function
MSVSLAGRFLQKHRHMSSKLATTVLACTLSVALVTAQTPISPPENKYSPQEDVQLGLQAASEARRQLPILRDDLATSYVQEIGRRLVDAIPSNLRHPEFRYSFEVVNVREINAFALPGGPMFVNRGMIEAAHDEGEVAGVMAHELSHVALRHGTAQASKAAKYEWGTVAGAVIGAIIGGTVGSVVAQGTQFGLGTAFLRFGREYERQADLQGAQIMARAGYDPRDMANMFKTIEKQGGSGGPEWLSDHPNPGNRVDYITREAAALRVENPIRNSQAFARVVSHLKSMPKAPTTEAATRSASRGGSPTPRGSTERVGTRVERPSSQFREFNEGDQFRVSVPANWNELPSANSVTFAPEGAYGQGIFTHGVELGVSRNETHNLQTATKELIDSLAQSNPNMRAASNSRRTTIDGRAALQTTLTNVSDATGQGETVQLVTTQTRSGDLFYAIAVAPQDEYADYSSVFQRVVNSIRLND